MSASDRERQRRRRLEELFLLATELSEGERVGFLERHAPDDAELRAELEALLLADESDPHGILVAPLVSSETTSGTHAGQDGASDSWFPERVGPYRVREKIGEGGMGSVWLAQQEEPIRREVALKFVRRGVDDGLTLERFERERQALAWMDHPGIARILDGGSTRGGLCWFAMEYAPGLPIDQYANEHRMSTRARCRLFVEVCAAVHHAHQKGVVHLDIKPSNVLVTEGDAGPQPKLIDFGIARAIGARAEGDPDAPGGGVGTHHYMSPEQADPRVDDVDIRSDVYSLGVLLYQLLSGALPQGRGTFRGLDLEAVADKLRSDQPQRPSERSGLDELRGDLDWIVERCMAVERESRYASAAELADDIVRFLRHEPVRVAPVGGTYRLRKALQRNRWTYATAGLLILTLVAGIAGTTRGMFAASKQRDSALSMRQQAEKEQADAERITRFLTDTIAIADPNVTLDPEVTVREMLDRAAARLEDSLEGDLEAEAMLRRAIGQAYGNLGEVHLAQLHLRRALELFDQVPGADQGDVYAALWSLIPVFDESDGRKTEEMYFRATALRLGLIAERDEELAAKLDGLTRRPMTEQQAEERLHAVMEHAQGSFAPGDPLWPVFADELGDDGFILGILNDEPQAVRFFEESVRVLRRELPAGHPQVARHLAWQAAVLIEQGEHAKALALAEEVLAICHESLPPDHWRLLEARSLVGAALSGRGGADSPTRGEDFLRRAYEGLALHHGPLSRATLEAQLRLLRHLQSSGQSEEAESLRAGLRHAYAFSSNMPGAWSRVVELFPPEQTQLFEAVSVMRSQLFPGRRLEDPERIDAEELAILIQNVGVRLAELDQEDPSHAILGRQWVAWCLVGAQARPGALVVLAEAALALLEPHEEAIPGFVADARFSLGEALLEVDRAEEAEPLLERSAEAYAQLFGSQAHSTLRSRMRQGACLDKLGRRVEAESLLVAALAQAREVFGESGPLTRRASSTLERIRSGMRGERTEGG